MNTLLSPATTPKTVQTLTLGLVGFGEVGKIFAQGLNTSGRFQHINTWDIQFKAPDSPPLRAAQGLGIGACTSIKDLCQSSDLIISAVTASNTLSVAQQAAPFIKAHSVFLDLNSASPGTKQKASQHITQAGGYYVEAGVMTSVPPYGISVPILLGGPQAKALAQFLNQLGMKCDAVSDQLGVASAIKMCRSIMIKGLEALVIESYSTARRYGVEDQVLPTLQETFPSIDWSTQGAYFFSRVVKHGKRRAEEMFESASTVSEAGLNPIMATAIAQKQQAISLLTNDGVFSDVPANAPWQAYADCILANSKNKHSESKS
jgi:3-hydroxyisobutyrate dehydrogenase-like beta-hydroxyacid dehydrogenase